ncbi:MAG: family beta-propeller repeat-containing protein [Bacillales bacterium]|jgi:YVTN family beta-propeller protein|nr:family beta-propeller repeat-containing protein [Bacillales bacterium]
MKKFWLAFTLISLLLTGCATKETTDNVKKETTTNNDKQQSKMDEDIAGGRIGHESIAFVGGGISNKIWIIDAKFHNQISTYDVGGPYKTRTQKEWYPNLNDVHAIAFTKDFKTMFTANWYGYDQPSYVIAVDPITLREKWRIPSDKGAHHLALSPDDRYLYVANQHAANVSVIDLQTKKKIKDIKVGEGSCYLSPTMYWSGKVIDAPYMFISVDKEDKVAVIDMKTNEKIKDIPVGGLVHGVNLSPDGKTVWAAVMGAKKVAIIDAEKLEVTGEIKFDGGPIHIIFSPDGKYGYVTTGDNQIHKVDFESHKVVWKSKGINVPAHLAVTPDGKELWTLNHSMDERYPFTVGGTPVSGVQVWDTNNGKLITEIVAEGVPHEIQFVPYEIFEDKQKKVAAKDHGDGHVRREEQLYTKFCASCHGQNYEGVSAPGLEKVGSKYSDKEILKIIKNGKGMMPGGLIKGEDAEKVAKWLSDKKK